MTDGPASEAAVDTFLELEKSGWKGRAATAMGSAPEHEAFFRTLCRTFAERVAASAAGAFCR